MPKTLRKDILRLIQTSKGRFFSLLAIVAIGVAFYVGVSASSPVMSASVDAYDDQESLKDITVYSDYGFDQEDVAAIQNLDGVALAEPAQFVDVIGISGTDSYVTRIHSYREDSQINQFVLRSGRLPENDHEVLAENGTQLESGFALGSTVKLSRPDDDLSDWLDTDTVTVVGTIDTPLYLNETKENSTLSNQYIRTYLYIPETAFVPDYYTEVNVLLQNGKSYNSFSNAYKTYAESVKSKIETLADTQADHRRQVVLSDAMQKYNDGLADYETGQQEYNDKISDGQQKIDDAQQQILEGEQAISDGLAKLADAQKTLDEQQVSASIQINAARAELAKAEVQLKQGEEDFSAAKTQYTAQETQLQTQLAGVNQSLTALPQLDQGIQDAAAGQTQLSTLKQALTAALQGMDPSAVTVGAFLQNPAAAAYADAIHQLADDSQTMQDLFTAIDQKTAALTATIQTLESQRSAILQAVGASDSATAMQILQTSQAQLTAGIQQIEEGLAAGEAKLDDARQKISNGYQQATNASVELDQKVADGQKEIDDGYATINQKKADLAQGKLDLADAQQQLADAKRDGQQKLQDAKADLDKAKQDIDDLKEGSWTVLDRSEHYASETYKDTIHQMAAIARIFPVFFFLVAALVCLTTMTRMVDEQRGQIGILRALGYTQMQCTGKYLLYAAAATLLGEAIGTVAGLLIFPPIIYNTWRMMYILPQIKVTIPWLLIFATNVSFLAVMLYATWAACRSDMKEVPAQLLRPKAPRLGKSTLIEKVPLIWNHITFTWKVTIRNLIRYKKRFFMTVLGVAGCTALLITGYGIRDSITTIVDTQFKEIYLYDGIVQLDQNLSVSDTQSLLDTVSQRDDVQKATLVGYYSGKVYSSSGSTETVRTEVYPDASQISQTYTLRRRTTQQPLTLDDSGVIISEKLAINLSLKVGDQITIESENGVRAQVPVKGICEMYVHHYVFMSASYYQSVFGTSMQANSLFIKAADSSNSQQLQKDLVAMDGVSDIEFYDVTLDNFNNMVKGLDIIVMTLIISSMSLAFVVLGNLTNVNISERLREIATLKVLGFRRKEVENYIYKENNILTLIGSLVGIPLGRILHHYIMGQVEMDYVMFGRQVFPQSILICVMMTLGFGMLVNLFMTKRLRSIQMVESLKSVE